jgi:hypothetical protein
MRRIMHRTSRKMAGRKHQRHPRSHRAACGRPHGEKQRSAELPNIGPSDILPLEHAPHVPWKQHKILR